MKNGNWVGKVVCGWFRTEIGSDSGAARAARARLRRCATSAEALAVAETHSLFRRLQSQGQGSPTPDQLAVLAITFARLNDIEGERLACLFGSKSSREGPRKLSELRFQSLIRTSNRRELIRPLRRCVAVLGSEPSCDGPKLAEDLYFWSESVRNRWCFEYFGAAPTENERKEETAS